MIIKFNNGRYSEPPTCKYIPPPGVPVSSCSNSVRHAVTFQNYEIPQFQLNIQLRPDGNRQPREEAKILGRMKYVLQLNGFRGDRG